MRLAPLEDQLTKIGVVSDENSAFRTGGRQNLLVLDARLEVDSNSVTSCPCSRRKALCVYIW